MKNTAFERKAFTENISLEKNSAMQLVNLSVGFRTNTAIICDNGLHMWKTKLLINPNIKISATAGNINILPIIPPKAILPKKLAVKYDIPIIPLKDKLTEFTIYDER